MAFRDWFQPDGTRQDLSADDLRREEKRLGIREEQAVARLQRVLTDKEEAFERGAALRSLALRRILARRFASAESEQATVERDILRIGKDLVTVRSLLTLVDGGKKPRGIGDAVADLQVSYEDDRVGEAAYRQALGEALGVPEPMHDPVAEVFRVWRALDRGEYGSVREAREALDQDPAPAAGGAAAGGEAGSRPRKK